MTAIGDIIETKQHPGQRWVIAGPASTPLPPGQRFRCLSLAGPYGLTSRTVGAGDMIPLVEGVTFEPGQVVVYDGRKVAVIGDSGATVRCAIPARPRPLPHHYWFGPQHYVEGQDGEIDIPKGDLVLANLAAILEQEQAA